MENRKNDYDILFQKFDNFKKFCREVSQNKEKLELLVSQDNPQMLARSTLLLAVYKKIGNVDLITNTTCLELGIADQHKDKIKRYFECFVEYLSSMHPNVPALEITEEMKQQVQEKIKELKIKPQ